ncbi:MAG: HepT-like ribonuclease domain-containing protein [Desulfobacteria bacterium]
MYNRQESVDRLKDVLEALERIPRRFESIHSPDDFLADETGLEHLDSICMILVAVGEAFRQLDTKTKGDWLARYPQIPWRDVIGVRNVIAHGYFDIDAEQVFNICKKDIPELIRTVRVMIKDLQDGAAS